jgi:hypothetical protein
MARIYVVTLAAVLLLSLLASSSADAHGNRKLLDSDVVSSCISCYNGSALKAARANLRQLMQWTLLTPLALTPHRVTQL